MRKKHPGGCPPASASRRVVRLTLKNLADRIAADLTVLDDPRLRESVLRLGLAAEAFFAAVEATKS